MNEELKFEKLGGEGSGGGVRWGGGVGSRLGGSGWGVRVDVNEELKFLGKLKKKTIFFLGGGVKGGVGLM